MEVITVIFAPKYKDHISIQDMELLSMLNNDEKISLQVEALKTKNLQAVESYNDLKKLVSTYKRKMHDDEVYAIWEFLNNWDYEHTTIDFGTGEKTYSLDAEHVVITAYWLDTNIYGYPSYEEYKEVVEKQMPDLEDMSPDDIIEQRVYEGEIKYSSNGYILCIPENFPWAETTMLRDYETSDDNLHQK
jgi:hypothetical protein